MRTWMSHPALVALLALTPPLVAACTGDSTLGVEEAAIRNGANAPEEINKVFMLLDPLGDEAAGSASNVKYKRCLLTAAHVVSQPVQGMLVYRGQDLRSLDDKEFQNIAAGEIRPDAADGYRDLAVLWATNQRTRPPAPPPGGGGGSADGGTSGGTGGTGGTAGEKRIPLSGWSPQGMIDSIGLANAQLDEEGDAPTLSAGAPKPATIIGYGNNTTDANGNDVGNRVLRKGTMNTTHFIDGAAQTHFSFTGGFYYLAPKAPENQTVCVGDSGGPARTTAGIFGVISTQMSANGCANAVGAHATALNRSHLPGAISNWDWVQQAIARVCKKNLSTGVYGQGKVIGSITPTQEHVEETWLNNQIRCGNTATNLTDCGEFVHENQSMTLTATPGLGWRFVRWYAMGAHCQCDGFTTPTCTIAYGAMGTYTESSSSDDESCYAEFELIPPAQDAGTLG